MFLYCELGERMTSAFGKLSELIDQMNWYSFSLEIQRMLPTFIFTSQQAVFIRGYGNTVYMRQTFKRVSSIDI